MIIKVHNKYYNIISFLNHHPGGDRILKECEGLDATNAFESYHALSDISKIKKIMKQYEIEDPPFLIESTDSTFDENGFYNVLKVRVKKHFQNKSTKWTYGWLIYLLLSLIIFITSYSICFICTHFSIKYRIVAAIIAGFSLLNLGFQCYHDASHSAISYNKETNKIISIIGSGLLFWDWVTWIKHHSVLHHSFTGNYKLDPDLRYTHPLLRKSKQSRCNYVNKKSQIITLLSVFPGMFFGQVILYFIGQRKKILGFKISQTKTLLEWIIICFQISIMYYGSSIILPITYFLASNIAYSMCILPDHDQLETHLNSKQNNKDWGEMQVRNSGNFAQNNIIFTRLSGGINYQIEHHLFPSLCSWHLPEISHIVKETCQEFDIKYISNPSIIDAYKSAINNLYLINN
jgi:linoleoyl-CoA desaturase